MLLTQWGTPRPQGIQVPVPTPELAPPWAGQELAFPRAVSPVTSAGCSPPSVASPRHNGLIWLHWHCSLEELVALPPPDKLTVQGACLPYGSLQGHQMSPLRRTGKWRCRDRAHGGKVGGLLGPASTILAHHLPFHLRDRDLGWGRHSSGQLPSSHWSKSHKLRPMVCLAQFSGWVAGVGVTSEPGP